MRKLTIILAVIAAMMLSAGAGVAKGRWDTQVTGGVTFDAGIYSGIELDVSARVDSEGHGRGQVQYTRSDLKFHIDVDCFHEGARGYAFSGPTKIQDGSFGAYATVEVNEAGTKIRVHDKNSSNNICGYTGSYPAPVASGSFNIR